jgi:hypothetical protein
MCNQGSFQAFVVASSNGKMQGKYVPCAKLDRLHGIMVVDSEENGRLGADIHTPS